MNYLIVYNYNTHIISVVMVWSSLWIASSSGEEFIVADLLWVSSFV